MSLRALFVHMRSMKHYLIAAVIVFLTGIVLGYGFRDSYQAFLDAQLGQLENTFRGVMQSQHRQLWLFFIIFLNNTVLSILMMYAGAIFAVIPVYFLITNGMLIGYLASRNAEGDGWLQFFKAIVPHGIIEIPAVLLACAYGIRFGFLLLEAIWRIPSAAGRTRVRIKLLSFLKATIPMMLVLGVLLLVAAAIESTFTMWLVGK